MLKTKLHSCLTTLLLVSLTIAALVLSGCDKDDDTGVNSDGTVDLGDIPEDLDAILTHLIPDDSNDFVLLPPEQDGPPYSAPVYLPYVDVLRIRLGIDNDLLYMRVDYAGPIPTGPVHLTASGEIEEQYITNQGMNISLNVDNDLQTGASGDGVWGVDIFFAVGFTYGSRWDNVYANYDFPDGDIHNNERQTIGEIVAGGEGYDYVTVRYDISGLGAFFPRGATVELGEWSEAESCNGDGTLKYHHFAFDPFTATTWTIPAE